jgi:hypothetical protein
MTTATTSTTPASSDPRLWTARDAIAEAFRKPRFAERAAYRAELFRLARHQVPDLTDADLDAALRAMVAAGNIQARKVNGKTMYHYTHFWQRQDEEARRALPPAFKPNNHRPHSDIWQDADYDTLAVLDKKPWGGTVTIELFDGNSRAKGTGATVREAYRAAWRQMRLSRHTVPDLLRERAGLRRMLDQAERKIAADGALQVWLYDEMGRLRARNVELALENEELTRKNEELIRKNEELARTNEEFQREAVGESLANDLTAIIAALTAERDQLRQQVERLQIEQVYLRQQAEEAWEKLDDLQAAQAREEESERLPF